MNQESTDQLIREHTQQTAWAKLISRYPWHHFITLTHRNPVSREAASLAFSTFIRRLERKGNGVWWCHVVETGLLGHHVHLHVLLGGTDHLTEDEISRAWWSGHAHVKIYDPDLNGIAYMTKDVESGEAEVEFSAHIDRTIRRWKRNRSEELSPSQQQQPECRLPEHPDRTPGLPWETNPCVQQNNVESDLTP